MIYFPHLPVIVPNENPTTNTCRFPTRHAEECTEGKIVPLVSLITIQTIKQIAAQTDPNEVLIEKGGWCFKAAQ